MEYEYKNIGWNILCGLASFGFGLLFESMDLLLCYKVSFLILVICSCLENIVLNELLSNFNWNFKKKKKKPFAASQGTIAKSLVRIFLVLLKSNPVSVHTMAFNWSLTILIWYFCPYSNPYLTIVQMTPNFVTSLRTCLLLFLFSYFPAVFVHIFLLPLEFLS